MSVRAEIFKRPKLAQICFMAFHIVSLYPEFQYMPTYLATLEERLFHLAEIYFIPKAVQVGL